MPVSDAKNEKLVGVADGFIESSKPLTPEAFARMKELIFNAPKGEKEALARHLGVLSDEQQDVSEGATEDKVEAIGEDVSENDNNFGLDSGGDKLSGGVRSEAVDNDSNESSSSISSHIRPGFMERRAKEVPGWAIDDGGAETSGSNENRENQEENDLRLNLNDELSSSEDGKDNIQTSSVGTGEQGLGSEGASSEQSQGLKTESSIDTNVEDKDEFVPDVAKTSEGGADEVQSETKEPTEQEAKNIHLNDFARIDDQGNIVSRDEEVASNEESFDRPIKTTADIVNSIANTPPLDETPDPRKKFKDLGSSNKYIAKKALGDTVEVKDLSKAPRPDNVSEDQKSIDDPEASKEDAPEAPAFDVQGNSEEGLKPDAPEVKNSDQLNVSGFWDEGGSAEGSEEASGEDIPINREAQEETTKDPSIYEQFSKSSGEGSASAVSEAEKIKTSNSGADGSSDTDSHIESGVLTIKEEPPPEKVNPKSEAVPTPPPPPVQQEAPVETEASSNEASQESHPNQEAEGVLNDPEVFKANKNTSNNQEIEGSTIDDNSANLKADSLQASEAPNAAEENTKEKKGILGRIFSKNDNHRAYEDMIGKTGGDVLASDVAEFHPGQNQEAA